MANQDRVNFVWAETALTTIPPVPVSEVAYRDTTQTPEQMEVGQQYDTIYNSARHNQLLFLITSVAKTLCENGIMPFLAGQEYSQYARCIFTDGKIYYASRAIEANESPYPTPKDESNVWFRENSGGGVSAGAVVPYYKVTLGGPESRNPIFWGQDEFDPTWLLCDGGSDGRGGTVPNLSERFVLGTTNISDIGNTGGGYSGSVTGTISSTVAGGTVSASTTVATNTGTTTATGSNSQTNVTATTTAVTTSGTVGNTTISVATMPSHNHQLRYVLGSQGGTNHYAVALESEGSFNGAFISNTGSNGAHSHSLTMNVHSHSLSSNTHTHTFTGSPHNHTIPSLTVNAPTFTGTAHTHTFTGSATISAPPYYTLCYFIKLPE
nr:MAG TPA: LONG TAIL FIBER PROTEIN P37 PROTEIN, FIBER PROTEIN.2A [Caudoviricetes sp.]